MSFENTVSAPWTLTVNNSTIINKHAGDAGGGLEEDGSGKIIINSGTVIADNTTVNQGAGIWLDGIQDGNVFQTANLTVTGATISNNTAQTMEGGGIGNSGDRTVTIIDSTIEEQLPQARRAAASAIRTRRSARRREQHLPGQLGDRLGRRHRRGWADHNDHQHLDPGQLQRR